MFSRVLSLRLSRFSGLGAAGFVFDMLEVTQDVRNGMTLLT